MSEGCGLASDGRSLELHMALFGSLDPSEELSLLRCFLNVQPLDSELPTRAYCWRYLVDSARLVSNWLYCFE